MGWQSHPGTALWSVNCLRSLCYARCCKGLNGFPSVNYTPPCWAGVATVHKSSCHAALCSHVSRVIHCGWKNEKETQRGWFFFGDMDGGKDGFTCEMHKKGLVQFPGASVTSNLVGPWKPSAHVYVCACFSSCLHVCRLVCLHSFMHLHNCKSCTSRQFSTCVIVCHLIKIKHSREGWENRVSVIEGNGWVER